MKTKNLALLAMLAMAAFVSCGEPEKEQPDEPSVDPSGEKEPEKPAIVVADVFFSAENGDYCYYAAPGKASEIELALVRSGNTAADTYTIKVMSASEGLTIPESVKFDEGQDKATIKITTPADGTAPCSYDFDLKLTGDNVNASASSEAGTLRCEGSVYVYKSVILASRFGTSEDTVFQYFGNFKQEAWILDAKTVILKKFLGSENDLTVKADDNNNVISIASSAYDLYTLDDGYGGTAYYFWHATDADGNGEYEWFYPKGDDRRYIYGLAIDIADGYDLLRYNDAGQLRLRLFGYQLDIYSEQDGVDKTLYWPYLYMYEYTDEEMAEIDFASYPELSTYPEAKEITESEKTVLEFYLGDVRLDDQEADLITNEDGSVSYVVENLWWSDCKVTFTAKEGVLTIAAIDKSGEEPVEALYESGNYTYFYSSNYIYFWPWSSDYYQGFTTFSYYNDPYYCTFDDAEAHGSLYTFWNFWSGENYDLGSDQEGYFDVYVK